MGADPLSPGEVTLERKSYAGALLHRQGSASMYGSCHAWNVRMDEQLLCLSTPIKATGHAAQAGIATAQGCQPNGIKLCMVRVWRQS